jgi:uncharacterized membrane protein YphA (DoxX/SURF4 family)
LTGEVKSRRDESATELEEYLVPLPEKPRRIVGWVLSVLLAALFLFSASFKLTKAEEAVKGFNEIGLGDKILLIGVGEVVSTILFLIPWTSSLGTLLLGSYMGGAIATHMEHGEGYVPQSVILILIWLAGWLRNPGLLESFTPKARPV